MPRRANSPEQPLGPEPTAHVLRPAAKRRLRRVLTGYTPSTAFRRRVASYQEPPPCEFV